MSNVLEVEFGPVNVMRVQRSWPVWPQPPILACLFHSGAPTT